MAGPEKKTKKSASESFAEIGTSLKKTWLKIEPRIGFFYTVALLLGITYSVFLVSQSLSGASSAVELEQKASNYSTKFDTKTIEKVRELNDNASSVDVSLPGGRINPFME